MVANCERKRADKNQLKFLSLPKILFESSQKWLFFSEMTFSVSCGSRVNASANQDRKKKMQAMKKQAAKFHGDSRSFSKYPAPMADALMKRLARPACIPKNVPRFSGGMILEIMEVQGLAVNPPPSPCQIKKRKVNIRAVFFPITGM